MKKGFKKIKSIHEVKQLLQFPGQLHNQISFMEDQVVRTWEIHLTKTTAEDFKFFLGVHNMTKEVLTSLRAFQDSCNDKSLQNGSKRAPAGLSQLLAPRGAKILDDPDPQEQGPAKRCRFTGCLKYFFQHNKKRAFCSNGCRIAHHRQHK